MTLLEKRSSLAAKLVCFGETFNPTNKSAAAYLQPPTNGSAHSGVRLKAKKPKCPPRDHHSAKSARFVPPTCQFPLGYQSSSAVIGGQSWFAQHQSSSQDSSFVPYYFGSSTKVPPMFSPAANFTSNSLDCGGYLKSPVISQSPNYGRIDYSSPIGPPPLSQCGSSAYKPECRIRAQYGPNPSQIPLFSGIAASSALGYPEDNSYPQGPPKLYKFKSQVEQMDSLHMSTVDYFSSMVSCNGNCSEKSKYLIFAFCL